MLDIGIPAQISPYQGYSQAKGGGGRQTLQEILDNFLEEEADGLSVRAEKRWDDRERKDQEVKTNFSQETKVIGWDWKTQDWNGQAPGSGRITRPCVRRKKSQ